MTIDKLKAIIREGENAKVDFKSEWYWNKNTGNEKKKQQQIELYKDIIGLTNGNIHYIGKTSYLIIGVEDNGSICGVVFDESPTVIIKNLIQNLQSYTEPPIQELKLYELEIESKNIAVIEIPYHPYLIILKQDLKGQYKQKCLLYRANEGTISVKEADYPMRKSFDDAITKYNNTLSNSIEISSKINNKFLYFVLALIIMGSIFFMIKDNSSQEATVNGNTNKITQTTGKTTGSQKIDVEGSRNELTQTKNNFDTKELCQDSISQYQKNIDELTKELHNTKDEKIKITITKKLEESKDDMKNLITDCTK